ncbi:Crp/Fnr family transcriptional regulator [Myceligenerans indicum]|uniref:Crp/Fnr family transcriptional regulator n=1 Tax=Myceligenerans indicum TaxID=2593663 RepID=A0ABS1LGA6_9MICO|nr:Crp/Fnr family transcriptional regulator [Myceligenerans indicum]MBL0885245.1 Crp/Fnr family transcriptional regulator [Myceligenerans indicum]
MRTKTPQCLAIVDPELLAGGLRPWSPGRREEHVDLDGATHGPSSPAAPWCMAEVDIFRDLDAGEMDALNAAAPRRTFPPGALVYTPHQPVETLFILKQGRIRIFRTSPDGRALTTAIIEPGTIFGEMVIIGQQMLDNYAEALDDVVVCVMNKSEVKRLLLGDPRIAIRISETLGRRLGVIERRLSDTVFKSVPQRIATTLVTLAAGSTAGLGRGRQVRLTHEQLAALAGTSRETTTKILGELSEQGMVSLGRGRINVLELELLRQYGGD